MMKNTICTDSTGEILTAMKDSRIYWQAKKQVVNSIMKNKKNIDHWKPSIEQVMKVFQGGQHCDKIKGLINNCIQKSTRRMPIEKDNNDQIQYYRHKWSEMTQKQFNNISGKLLRQQQYDEQDESVSYIYDCSALLQFLCSIRVQDSIIVRQSSVMLFPYDLIKVQKYHQIRTRFSFLLMQENIVGGDQDQDLRQRQKKAKKISDGENIAIDIENYLCFGCVSGERVSVYKKYFECFYEHIGKKVQYSLYEKIWRQLIRTDCREILKQPNYFIFKEQIIKVYQNFICDKQLSQMLKIKQFSPTELKMDKYAPINGTLPCKSFSTYIAPFCYTSNLHEDIYQIFREVYCNYFILLNTISSYPSSILSLCIIFEEIISTTQKKIITKLQNLNIHPLKIVFPWIFYCFIGYINIQQFFLLLDRIIGMKSLQIIPIYCVSLFFKNKTAILDSKSQGQIVQLMQNSLKEDIFIQTIRQFFKYHL